MSKSSQQIDIIRHSCAHILATAVLEMFPEAKLGIGPIIENGFYYDFDLPRTLVPEDLLILEEKMRGIIKNNYTFEKQELSAKEVISLFEKLKQPYKVELIKDLLKENEDKNLLHVSCYMIHNFVDLCRGPHIDSTGEIKPDAFKLTKIAGAYWRGSEKNKMLQRIYGACFKTKKELDEYLNKIVEAGKRDHRVLGQKLDLFHIDEEVGAGLPLWHPKGALLWRVIEDFWYKEHLKNGYELVRSPHIGNQKLWEISGHWGFYNESMYPPLEIGQTLKESQGNNKIKESEHFLLKPMNCPFHIQIFNNRSHSYRDLPLRWAECGTVYRYEKKGELSGLIRVRGFTQDDAHIICRAEQVETELKKVIDFILFIYKSFGFEIKSINTYLSVRDKESKKYTGADQGWDFTEKVLEKIAKEKGLNYKKDIGGAVFYGPKLDFKIKDSLDREWQCSTLQFDFNLPERFNMSFINARGEKEGPYMLHRALFGSFERFIGLLIEHYAGAFPLWLAPAQISIIPIADRHKKYAQEIEKFLKEKDIRVELRDEAETVGKKIRQAEIQKIPYMIIIGDKEEKSKKISVRHRDKGDIGAMSLKKFYGIIEKEIKEKK